MAQFGETESLAFALASFACGLFLLERGADNFVDSAAVIAERLGVSPVLVGLLTCGAEWEELVVMVVALGQGQYPMALGNLMGSSIANVLGSFSLGLLCAQNVMVFDRSARIYSTALLGLVSAFVLALYVPAQAKWMAGIGLVVAFVFYVASVTWLISKGVLAAPEDDSDLELDSYSASDSDSDTEPTALEYNLEWDGVEDEHKGVTRSVHELQGPSCSSGASDENAGGLLPAGTMRSDERRKVHKPLRKHVSKLLFGLGSLALSGYVLAHSARTIGDGLGLSGTVTGTTILSLATTLPEKLVAVLAGSRHQQGILVANAVGSNIFLVTLCGGVLFIWGAAGHAGDTANVGGGGGETRAIFSLGEALVMWASSAALFLVVVVGGRRWMGFVLICSYVGFLCLEVIRAT
ncbi:hypothetical protein SLS53_001184 [Cytospora paraplurivora]|uniref:Sodium/calcium exchanger membrane region domain-containing protein n=1 Tax=Cytospora paraplurivora TaxID=2898453 RepID=A0AAN9YM96_9PEZI